MRIFTRRTFVQNFISIPFEIAEALGFFGRKQEEEEEEEELHAAALPQLGGRRSGIHFDEG